MTTPTKLRWMPWLLLAGLPLLFWPDSPDLYGTIRWGAMAAVGTLFWLLNFRRWEDILRAIPPWILVAMLVFSGMGVLSMAVALHPLEAGWDVVRWLMLLGLMVGLAGAVARDPSVQREIWRAGTVAGGLVGGMRVLQYAGILGEIPAGGDPNAATLGNENFFAGAMVFLVAFGLAAALLEKGFWRWAGLGAAVLCLVLAVMGGSSGALLALGGLGAVVLEGGIVLQWPQSFYARKIGWRLPMVILVLLAAGAVFGWVMLHTPSDVKPGADSTLERILLWKKSGEMIAEAPVLGVGAGHWHYHILRLGTVSNYQGFATRYFMQAHNDYLQLTAERGVLGGLAFVGILGMAWFRGWRRMAPAPDQVRTKDYAGWMAWGGLTAWMVFACTNLPGEQPYLSVFLVVFGAMLISSQDRVPVPSTGVWWKGVGALFFIGTVLCLIFHLLWLGADRANFKVLEAKLRQDWSRTEKLAQKAATWYNPHDRITATPLVWFEGIALISMGNARAALPKLLDAKAQHPWHPQVSSNLGVAHFMVGDHAACIHELQELVDRFPEFGEARMNLTEAYLTVGNTAKAAETIAYWKVHVGDPRFDDYYAKISALLAGRK